jgi:hypothetical protein
MTETNSLTGRSYLVYLLPFLHLGGCLAIWLSHNLEYMIVIDFPISILFVVLMYKGVNPVISFGILGTLWWYLLSLAVRWVVGIIASPRRS